MARTANLYDLCDPVLRSHPPTTEPGRNLALIYRTLAGNPFLKYFLLKRCRHPAIPMAEVPAYQAVFRAAITKPLDYYGAVPIWFDKPFHRPGGDTVREMLGNEICPGHNMDILDSILRNRRRWRALEGENLEVVHRFLEFHHRAYASGNFRIESALKYYLPEIYVYYTGRSYDTVLGLDDAERVTLDPSGKIEEIRRLAIEYVRDDVIGATLNPFDAALAISALVLLRYPSREDGVVATALDVLVKALGEGRRGHPYKAYEWNRMRHPTRIVVGSEVATSLFVMNAAVDARRFLFGRG